MRTPTLFRRQHIEETVSLWIFSTTRNPYQRSDIIDIQWFHIIFIILTNITHRLEVKSTIWVRTSDIIGNINLLLVTLLSGLEN